MSDALQNLREHWGKLVDQANKVWPRRGAPQPSMLNMTNVDGVWSMPDMPERKDGTAPLPALEKEQRKP